MRLWVALYGLIWLVVVEFLLGTWPNPPAAVPYLHVALGVAIVIVAYANFAGLRATRVPGRVKRTARATFALALFMAFVGILLGIGFGRGVDLLGAPFYEWVLAFHVFLALAILSQVSAVAVAYDMWEEREFDRPTESGAVPPAPAG